MRGTESGPRILIALAAAQSAADLLLHPLPRQAQMDPVTSWLKAHTPISARSDLLVRGVGVVGLGAAAAVATKRRPGLGMALLSATSVVGALLTPQRSPEQTSSQFPRSHRDSRTLAGGLQGAAALALLTYHHAQSRTLRGQGREAADAPAVPVE